MAARFRSIWPPVVIALAFLGAWQFIVVANDIKPFLLPAPTFIVENLAANLDGIAAATFYTGTTAFTGLVLGTIVAALAALLASRVTSFARLMTPLTAGLAAVPIVALTPILNNMWGITSRSPRVIVTMIIVFFPVFVNVVKGLSQVSPVQLELMRSLNATPRTTLRVLRIPNAVPFFFTAMKVAAPLSVIAALVSEYFGGPQEGLGSRIASSAANTAYGRAWAYVVAAIVLGLAFYLAVLAIERLTTPRTGRGQSA